MAVWRRAVWPQCVVCICAAHCHRPPLLPMSLLSFLTRCIAFLASGFFINIMALCFSLLPLFVVRCITPASGYCVIAPQPSFITVASLALASGQPCGSSSDAARGGGMACRLVVRRVALRLSAGRLPF